MIDLPLSLRDFTVALRLLAETGHVDLDAPLLIETGGAFAIQSQVTAIGVSGKSLVFKEHASGDVPTVNIYGDPGTTPHTN